ncbi:MULTISPECIES: TetR family transcriptional regulator [unclassified Nocardioides]|uniref:TetR family transcriptional regulator n=1 Tax=unclassified Nocardioides TaxID=2615069 RepID=UPI00138F4FD6|nr:MULTISPECIES: TetR family transcriptional regulator [unclassified Nocardioides]
MTTVHERVGTAPAASTTQRPGGTATRILDAAARLLAEKGYGGLRISDVAKAADVRPAAIYYYFASREVLVEEVLWFGMARLRRHVEETLLAAGDEVTAIDRLLLAVEMHLRYELEISDYTQASIRNAGQVTPEIRERQRQEFRAYRQLWLDLVDAAADEGGLAPDADRRLGVMLTIGALNGTVEWWRPHRGDLQTVIDHACLLVRHGLFAAADTTPAPAAHAVPASPPAPPTRPAPPISSETRDRILAATAATLRARGYSKCHLSEVAERASVQAPAIYHYFTSRDSLITEVLSLGQRAVGNHMRAAVEALPADADPRHHVAALTEAYLRVELELSDFATAVTRNVGQVPAPVRAALLAEGDRLHALWHAPLEDAAALGLLRPGLDPAITRMLVLGALNWVPEWWHPGVPVDRLVKAAHRLLGNGLFPSPLTTAPPQGD